MLFLAILLVCTTSSEAFRLNIVNGTDAKDGEFPFMVSLRRDGKHVCGGSILDSRHILTAAHCVYEFLDPDPNIYSIQYGTYNSSNRPENQAKVSIICISPEYNWMTSGHDYTIIRLSSELPSDDSSWSPVPTVPSDYMTDKPQKGTIIGWGATELNGPTPEILQKLTVDVYTTEQCSETVDIYNDICFGSSSGSACIGDSGSPLLSEDGLQIGLGSYILNASCGTADLNTPNVYLRLSRYINLIKILIARDSDDYCFPDFKLQ